jgi:hypothetical protein
MMLQATVTDILTGKFYQAVNDEPHLVYSSLNGQDLYEAFFEYLASHCLYLIRDGSTVLYIGHSKTDIMKSIGGYVGLTSLYENSAIGRLIRANRPIAYQWVIELFTLDDVMHFLLVGEGAAEMTLYEFGRLHPEITYDRNFLEQRLIRDFHPCLNIAYNPTPTRLPSHYHLPHNDIPEGILCSLRVLGIEYKVSYQAYDFASQKHRKYAIRMYAEHFAECRKMVIRLLGYEPEHLFVTPVKDKMIPF